MVETSPLRVAVVGAGPAGLAFASILHRKSRAFGKRVPWKVALYEAENRDARRVGGSLDLGRRTGLKALEAAGLFNRFHDFARPQGQEIRLVGHHGDLVFHYAGDATPDDDCYSPEIYRADLMRLLVESLPDDAIQWNHKVQAVRPVGNGFELEFAGHKTVTADVVVGADGAWSRVRPLVTQEKPTYPDADATFLDIPVPAFNSRYPELADVVGEGTLYRFGGGNMLVVEQNSRDVVHVYLGLRAPRDWRQHELIRDFTTDRERVQALAKAFFSSWGDSLRAIAMAAADNVDDETLLSWPLYAMPVGVQWLHRRGVTLMGDAAHLMSPCAGEGVNTAMIDAMELALAFVHAAEASPSNFHQAAMGAIEQYEKEMFPRAEDPAKRSADNMTLFFTVPEMSVDHAAQMFGPPGSA